MIEDCKRIVQNMICTNFFTNRIVNMWNSLPNVVVVHAESTNIFKSRLDKFWSNQEIIYDYRAEIQGTGSQSVNY